MANISIAFVLAHAPLRTGAFPVRCRITIKRKHAYFNTPFQVQKPSEFDELKQSFTKNKNGNARLNIMRGEIQTLYGQLMHENPTAQLIKSRYLNSFDSKATISQAVKSFIEHKQSNPDIKAVSLAILEDRLRHFQQFIAGANMENRRANEISTADIEAFELYLQGVRKQNGNPLRRRADFHQAVNSFFIWAEEKQYVEASPYKFFKMPKAKPTRRKDYLTLQELNSVLNASTDALSKKQSYYLKMFLFAVTMGGISFADLKGLKVENIKERSGRLWFVKPRQKVENSTGEKLDTPFSDLARTLYEELAKHRTAKEKSKGLALYVIQSTLRTSLIEAIKILGIDKHITSHCSRTSFSAAMALLGEQNSVIKSMLGHKQGDTLHEHYLQVQDEVKIRAMDKLSEAILNYHKQEKP